MLMLKNPVFLMWSLKFLFNNFKFSSVSWTHFVKLRSNYIAIPCALAEMRSLLKKRNIKVITSFLLRPDIFFLPNTLLWRHTLFDIRNVELLDLFICHKLSVFPNSPVRIFSTKLKMLYQIIKADRNTIFSVAVLLIFQRFKYCIQIDANLIKRLIPYKLENQTPYDQPSLFRIFLISFTNMRFWKLTYVALLARTMLDCKKMISDEVIDLKNTVLHKWTQSVT